MLLPCPLVDAHNELVCLFCFLDRLDCYLVGADRKKLYFFPQCALMFGGSNSYQRLVQLRGSLLGQFTPFALMGEQRIGEQVDTQVLVGLMGIAITCRRGVYQGQAQTAVSGFVPPVLAVVEYRQAITAVDRRHVGPLVSLYFVAVGRAVASFNGTQRDVVGGFGIAESHLKVGFQHALMALPVNL